MPAAGRAAPAAKFRWAVGPVAFRARVQRSPGPRRPRHASPHREWPRPAPALGAPDVQTGKVGGDVSGSVELRGILRATVSLGEVGAVVPDDQQRAARRERVAGAGSLLRELTLDPARDDQPLGTPPGPP